MNMREFVVLHIFLFFQVISITHCFSGSVIYLPDQDSQLLGNFERNLINITHNITTTTTTSTITESLEFCADNEAPYLFVVDTNTVLGCGLMHDTINTYSGNTSETGSGNQAVETVQVYKTELYGVVSLPVFMVVNFTVDTGEVLVNCTFDPGDDVATSVMKRWYQPGSMVDPVYTHHYLVTGNFRVGIRCVGNDAIVVNVSRRIIVEVSPVIIQDIECPEYFSTNVTSSCVLNVVQAVGVKVRIGVGETKKVDYDLPETRLGLLETQNVSLQEISNHIFENDKKLFIIPSMFFETRFHLRAIELVSTITGPLELHILRVTNRLKTTVHGGDEQFCPENNIQPDNSSTTVCFENFTKHYTGQLPITLYTEVTAVHSITLFVVAGYNYVMLEEPDVFVANPGDVIGLTINQSYETSPTTLPKTSEANTESSFASDQGRKSSKKSLPDSASDKAKSKSKHQSLLETDTPPTSAAPTLTAVITPNPPPSNSTQNNTSEDPTENSPTGNSTHTGTSSPTGTFYITTGTSIPTGTVSFPGSVSHTSTSSPVIVPHGHNLSSNYSTISPINQLSVHGSLPYQVRISMGMTHPGLVPVRVLFTDHGGAPVSGINYTAVVLEPVQDIILPFSRVSPVNFTQIMKFYLARGTDPNCTWQFAKFRGLENDVLVLMSGTATWYDSPVPGTLGAQFNYTHLVYGTYKLLVDCWNHVSSVSEDIFVVSRRNITSFNASLCNGTYTYEFTRTCWIGEAFGDGVWYWWYINGSMAPTRFKTFDTEFFNHSRPGELEYANVTAMNYVSQKHIDIWFKIVENPLSLIKINATTMFPSGSDFMFLPILSWKDYQHASEFYDDYGIQINNSLEQFISRPMFRVKVDNQVILVNISNATTLSYVFPKTGETSTKRCLLVEAMGHEILNRRIYVTIMDRVESLKIMTSCASEVLVDSSCLFSASYSQGSDVIVHWRIEAFEISSDVHRAVSYKFMEPGNVTVELNATNAVSHKQAVFQIVVRSQFLTTSSSISILPSPSPISHTHQISQSTSMTTSSPCTRCTIQPTTAGTSVHLMTRTTLSQSSSSIPSPPAMPLTIYGPRVVRVGESTKYHASITSTNLHYTWFINDVIRGASNANLTILFTIPGVFEITVRVANHITERRASIVVTSQSLIFGLKIYSGPEFHNQTAAILFALASGTNVAFSADFGDGTAPSSGIMPDGSRNVSVVHFYLIPGFYNVTVNVSNIVGPNISQTITIRVVETCHVESVSLRGLSPDSHLSPNIGETDKVTCVVDYIANCSARFQLKFRWSVSAVASGTPETVKWSKTNAQNSERASFPAINLVVGKYKVTISAVMPNGTRVSRAGFFTRVSTNFLVACSCGNSRTVSRNKAFRVTARVVGDVRSGNLSYQWFCDESNDVTCFNDAIPRDSAVLEFPGNFFTLPKIFNFVALATDGVNMGTCSQRVTVGYDETTLELCLSSSQNSANVIYTSETEITVSCSECGPSTTLWSWNLVPLTSAQPTNALDHLILNQDTLTIPPYTLQPDTLYSVTVNVSNSASKHGYAVLSLFTKHLPLAGSCHMTPTQATVLRTAVVCECEAWHDEHHPLTYQFLYSRDGVTYILFYHGDNPRSSAAYLEAGYESRNYTVDIKVIVQDSLGNSVTKFYAIKNLPLSNSAFGEMFNTSGDMAEQVASLLNGTDSQTATQLVKTVSGVLNDRSAEFPEEQAQRSQIREALLSHISSLSFTDGYASQQTAQTLLTALRVPAELTAQAQVFAANIYLEMCENLNGTVGQGLLDDLVEGFAAVMTASSTQESYINISTIRVINQITLAAIDRLGDFLLRGLVPSDPPIMLHTPLLNIALQQHMTSDIPRQTLMVSSHLNQFVCPDHIGNFTGDVIGTKFVSIQNNPYIWTPNDTLSPTTTVASLVFQDPDGQEMVIKNLTEPFSIFLYTPHHSRVPVNISGELEEHATDKFYEITRNRDNTAVLVTFHDMTADAEGQLRLRLRDANRSTVFGEDVIISTSASFPVFVTWSNLGHAQGKYRLEMEYESFSVGYQERPRQLRYTLSIQGIGCFYWSEHKEEWVSDGCQVGLLSTDIRTHCLCNHLTWFGGSLVVPPNPISLATIAERIQDPSNYPTILSVISVIFFIYLLAILWARRQDRIDKNKKRVTWSPSNHVTDTHHYEVIVYTGIRRNAGTSANVGMTLTGESGKSRKYLLKDTSKKSVLRRGGIDPFVITTEESLGTLQFIHIWHDNSGLDPAWFVNQVVVTDAQTGHASSFLCYRWLAVDAGDGQIQRLVPVADAEELVRFRHLFVSRATNELTDAHLWFSVVFRPVFSTFTRVQRVSCCFSLLLSTMMVNAMWYQTGGDGDDLVDLGLFTFSWEGLFVGVCSSLIVLPPNILLVQFFRHCRSKRHAKSSSQWTHAQENETSLNLTSSKMTSSTITSSAMTSSFVTPTHMTLPQMTSRLPASLVTPSYITTSNMTASPDTSPCMTSSHATSDMASPELAWSQGRQKKGMLALRQQTIRTAEKTSLLSRQETPPLDMASQLGMTSQLGTTSHLDMTSSIADKSKWLPSWFLFVAWFSILVMCVTSATVTLFYGVQFGEAKTKRWLLSFSVSVVNDIFVSQPLKVLGIAIILAYFIRKPFKVRHYMNEEAVEHERLVTSAVAPADVDIDVPDLTLCTAEQFLEKAREEREKAKFMHRLLKTMCSYFVFMILVLIIAYGQRDTDAYHLFEVQENTFVRPGLEENGTLRGFYEVRNVRDFWLWNDAVFIPAFSNVQWFNYTGKWSPFAENFGGYVFGAARWRQKRLKDGVCHVLPIFRNIIPHCSGKYKWVNEDSASYHPSWRTMPSTPDNNNISCNPPDLWCYQDSSALKTFPFIGDLETYSGGGYTIDILPNYTKGLDFTRDIREHGWIDEYTRAVFVEFTLYNPNVNLFSVMTLLFEVSPSGNFLPKAEILSIRLFNYVGNFQIFILVCHVLFLLFVCFFTYRTGKSIFQEKCAFLKKTWNVYEVMVVAVSWLLVAFYIISTATRKWTLAEFRENPTKFTSFWYSSSWNMSLEYVIAWLVFLVSLKLLRLFQFNRRMFLLPLTLSNTIWDLANYSLVFGLVMMAFAFLYYLVLQSYDSNFAGVIVTIETLLRVLLGKSNMVVQRHQFPVLERIMLFGYICLMRFILVNIFVIILNDGFFRAREAVNLRRNDFEFLDFMKDLIYDNFGIRRLYQRLRSGSAKSPYQVRFFENEEDIEYQLETMEKKVQRLCELAEFISSVSADEEFFEETYFE